MDKKSLNPSLAGIPPSATLAINELSARLEAQGKSVTRFGLGQSPFPVPGSVVEALRAHAAEKDYLPLRGLPALREAVAAFHQRTNRLDCEAQQVLIGPGSKELMFHLQFALQADLLLPDPAWVSYRPQAQLLGRRCHSIPCSLENSWKLQAEDLDAFCQKDPEISRILLLNYPCNPTGASYVPDELEALAEVARRYKILVLSDEIYGELNYSGVHSSIAQFYPEGTIVSAGLSKWCGAGGWRLGTFVIPKELEWLQSALAVIASESYSAVSAPVQHAAIRAFEGGDDIEEYLKNCRRILSCVSSELSSIFRSAGAELLSPEGGFYMFPDFSAFRPQLESRGIKGSREMARRALEETGVAFLPGSDFGVPDEQLFARLAFVGFDGQAALEYAASYVGELGTDFLERHCQGLLNGAERLVAWLGGEDSDSIEHRSWKSEKTA